MKVFVTGGTGLVGRNLTANLVRHGHQVTVMTRNCREVQKGSKDISYIEADPTIPGTWQEQMREHDAAINLAGASIVRRWTKRNRELIRDSRILSTKRIIEALYPSGNEVTRLISGSGIGYYGHRGDEILKESSTAGSTFLATIASEWESTALQAEEQGTSVVVCRLGHVLAREGGVMGKLVPLFKIGMGSRWGNGNQWFSWVHEDDLANIFLFLLEAQHVKGPINATAPNPIPNKEMAQILREVLNRPALLPKIPVSILRPLLGEFASVFTDGQRVMPDRLINYGFRFEYPNLKKSFQHLLKKQPP